MKALVNVQKLLFWGRYLKQSGKGQLVIGSCLPPVKGREKRRKKRKEIWPPITPQPIKVRPTSPGCGELLRKPAFHVPTSQSHHGPTWRYRVSQNNIWVCVAATKMCFSDLLSRKNLPFRAQELNGLTASSSHAFRIHLSFETETKLFSGISAWRKSRDQPFLPHGDSSPSNFSPELVVGLIRLCWTCISICRLNPARSYFSPPMCLICFTPNKPIALPTPFPCGPCWRFNCHDTISLLAAAIPEPRLPLFSRGVVQQEKNLNFKRLIKSTPELSHNQCIV